MNIKICKFALIYFQDKIWVIGGRSNFTTIDTIETNQLNENKWTTIDSKLLSKRSGHSAVVHNKKFFVIGGYYQNERISSVEVYTSATNQFSFVSAMSQAHAYFRCKMLNDSLMVFGVIKIKLN